MSDRPHIIIEIKGTDGTLPLTPLGSLKIEVLPDMPHKLALMYCRSYVSGKRLRDLLDKALKGIGLK